MFVAVLLVPLRFIEATKNFPDDRDANVSGNIFEAA
jgi:hypothetical protein